MLLNTEDGENTLLSFTQGHRVPVFWEKSKRLLINLYWEMNTLSKAWFQQPDHKKKGILAMLIGLIGGVWGNALLLISELSEFASIGLISTL